MTTSEKESFVSTELISALQNPGLYDHPVESFEVLETHISWVILTGPYAYKIKKPVDFGFLDFSSLDRRKHFCAEELRLNSRLAPTLYLDVVPITGSAEQPQVNGAGEPFEYAIRMRQFDQSGLFDAMQEKEGLDAGMMRDLAQQVAAFHRELPAVADDKPLGTPEAVFAAMKENFEQIRPLLEDDSLLPQLEALESWTECTFERHQDTIASRRERGFVRECHGDLHLTNITRFEDQVTVFDCIEFNEPFRWIDTINDLAFLLMDLESRNEYALSADVLNVYLEYSGDFEGVQLLTMYKTYRALVRAKIALFMLGNPSLSDDEKQALHDRYRSYAALAESYSETPIPYLLATAGLSGSGKTVISSMLSTKLGLIRLRSDVERKRLHGLDPLASSRSGIGKDMYSEEANRKTYERLASLATQLLLGGNPVIIDSAALRQSERAAFDDVATNLGLPFALIDCKAPEETRKKWVRERNGDASEATEQLLEEQKKWVEPLTAEENTHTVHVHTDTDRVAESLADRIRAHFGHG